MKKFIITADIHGSYNGWLTITSLMGPQDSLVVAGDLFDTIYGSYTNADYQPEAIKSALSSFPHPFYYVYGNCDSPRFFPGFEENTVINAFEKTIFLHHGHRKMDGTVSADIVIQGHTHCCFLEKKGSRIFLNPGSIVRPRNALASYGVIDQSGASLVELKTGQELARINF